MKAHGKDSYTNQGDICGWIGKKFSNNNRYSLYQTVALRRSGKTRKFCVHERIWELLFTDTKGYNKKRPYTISHRMEIWQIRHFTQKFYLIILDQRMMIITTMLVLKGTFWGKKSLSNCRLQNRMEGQG